MSYNETDFRQINITYKQTGIIDYNNNKRMSYCQHNQLFIQSCGLSQAIELRNRLFCRGLVCVDGIGCW
jgi:hypothetical protein